MDSFIKNLKNIKYPLKNKKEKESWDVEGILKNRTNKSLKFDLRPLSKYKNNAVGKKVRNISKADKIVFDLKNQWIIVDVEELREYCKKTRSKQVLLKDLIFELDWNIVLPKY